MIRHAGSQDVALELVDASALLWRLYLEGTPVGDRWQPLTSAWAGILRPGFYPFNDMHAVMSFVGNGEQERAEDLVRELDEVAARPSPGSTGWEMTRLRSACPMCRSVIALRSAARYDAADRRPAADQDGTCTTFGGSHAQRDAVERTLLEAAIRAGRLELASALVSERISVRDCNTYAWSKRAWLKDAAGDADGAASAQARSNELAGQIRVAAG